MNIIIKKLPFYLIYGILIFSFFKSYGQESVFRYTLDLTKNNDAFNVTLSPPPLTEKDSIYRFVSYAPGVHQPLDFGRFVKSFKVYDNAGNELLTQKISTNEFKILKPTKVSSIVYEIDDSFDMAIGHHPIYPMSGTGITPDFTIVNPFGVFGYFEDLKNNPIDLILKLEGHPKVGTALNKNNDGVYAVDSYYDLTDSPILIGVDLSYSSKEINGLKVEAFVYSPDEEIFSAQRILDDAEPILKAAMDFIGYAPVPRYTFLMYFSDDNYKKKMPVFGFAGALEHSLSSTYTLPAKARFVPYLKNNIAHEFMHILSPLHLHSNILAHFDYSDAASEDKHLWLYEGVTEWASYVMQVRAGLLTADDYLNYLTEKINKSKDYDPDFSLVRLSKEWSTDKGNKQYNNIYQLGALTAAMLDIKLLQLSDGKKGLREVYLDLINGYGKDQPFSNDTFFDDLVAMTYPEIRTFIDNHIKNNTDFNFEEEMKSVGIHYYAEKSGKKNVLEIDGNPSPKTKNLREILMGKSKQKQAYPNGIGLQDSVRQAYGTLTDSTVQYDFGTRCYYTGIPTEGRKAINILRKTENTDLIKKVLKGNNKEGKIYAIEALLEMNMTDELQLSAQNKEQIRSIINSDFEVNRCQGGMVSTIHSVDLFEEKFQKLLEINKMQL